MSTDTFRPGYVAENIPAEKNPQDVFDQMSRQIAHNKEAAFGGAFVISPPSGEALTALLLGSTDEAQFWMLVSAKVQTRLREIQDREVNQGTFGRR